MGEKRRCDAENADNHRADGQWKDAVGGGGGGEAAQAGPGGGNPERRLATGVSRHDHRHGKRPRRLRGGRLSRAVSSHRHLRRGYEIQPLRVSARFPRGLRAGAAQGSTADSLRWHGALRGVGAEGLQAVARAAKPGAARRAGGPVARRADRDARGTEAADGLNDAQPDRRGYGAASHPRHRNRDLQLAASHAGARVSGHRVENFRHKHRARGASRKNHPTPAPAALRRDDRGNKRAARAGHRR